MLNANLDLNITDYVVVDFSAVAKLVDDLGGISVYMTKEEVVHLNNYCGDRQGYRRNLHEARAFRRAGDI